ncbi:MAG TPA: gamma-glutamyl-gamma-aminobutyrate hydrolase family protein [Vicinamibacterales bacterium]
MSPTIGITRCSRIDDYVASVERAGGEPLILEATDDPAKSLERIDGLLLTGGADVDPGAYDEPPHPSIEVDSVRDAFEIPLSREALASDMPIFAICRGVQVLNVAAGGSLVQDIPSALTSDVNHALEHPKDAIAHPIEVVPRSRLAGWLGGDARPSATVNSRHHQSVARVASTFVVSAVSPDGVVEAIERPEGAFCLGVQWHPENFWRTGEFASLFDAFVAASRRTNRTKARPPTP